jgi:hypothetical protein
LKKNFAVRHYQVSTQGRAVSVQRREAPLVGPLLPLEEAEA